MEKDGAVHRLKFTQPDILASLYQSVRWLCQIMFFDAIWHGNQLKSFKMLAQHAFSFWNTILHPAGSQLQVRNYLEWALPISTNHKRDLGHDWRQHAWQSRVANAIITCRPCETWSHSIQSICVQPFLLFRKLRMFHFRLLWIGQSGGTSKVKSSHPHVTPCNRRPTGLNTSSMICPLKS